MWASCCTISSQQSAAGPDAPIEPDPRRATGDTPASGRDRKAARKRVAPAEDGATSFWDSKESTSTCAATTTLTTTEASSEDAPKEGAQNQRCAEFASIKSISHSKSLLSDPSQPSSLGLSHSFLSRSGSTMKADACVQTDFVTDQLCARCGRPPRLPSRMMDSFRRLTLKLGGSISPRLSRGGRRRSSNSSSSSTSCVADRDSRSGGRSFLVPRFAETPRHTQMMCLTNALEHINPSGDGCCPFHVAAAAVASVLQEMAMQECMPDYSPLLSWQCPGCLAMNGDRTLGGGWSSAETDFEILHCNVCGEQTHTGCHVKPSANPLCGGASLARAQDVPSSSQDASWRGYLHQPTPQRHAGRPEGGGDDGGSSASVPLLRNLEAIAAVDDAFDTSASASWLHGLEQEAADKAADASAGDFSAPPRHRGRSHEERRRASSDASRETETGSSSSSSSSCYDGKGTRLAPVGVDAGRIGELDEPCEYHSEEDYRFFKPEVLRH